MADSKTPMLPNNHVYVGIVYIFPGCRQHFGMRLRMHSGESYWAGDVAANLKPNNHVCAGFVWVHEGCTQHFGMYVHTVMSFAGVNYTRCVSLLHPQEGLGCF